MDLCKHGEPRTISVENGIPEDSQIVNKAFDISRNAFALCIESETFDPVLIGCQLPVLDSPTFRVLRADVTAEEKTLICPACGKRSVEEVRINPGPGESVQLTCLACGWVKKEFKES